MIVRTEHVLACDVDGGLPARTVRWLAQGTGQVMQIDLCPRHYRMVERLDAELSAHARPLTRTRVRAGQVNGQSNGHAPDTVDLLVAGIGDLEAGAPAPTNAEIRAWAASLEPALEVRPSGRISESVRERYNRAHGLTGAVTA